MNKKSAKGKYMQKEMAINLYQVGNECGSELDGG